MRTADTRVLVGICSLACWVLLAGCTPSTMKVREGGDPRYVDDKVLFRTTYYFRAFDYCEEVDGASTLRTKIQSDSLYRFRMTGKGYSLYNQVRFESGTLYAYQIDPFGASVEFDKATGRPHFVSQQKRDEEIQRNKLIADIKAQQQILSDIDSKLDTDHSLQSAVQANMLRSLRLSGAGDAGARNSVDRARPLYLATIDGVEELIKDEAKKNAFRVKFEPVREAIKSASTSLVLDVAVDDLSTKLGESCANDVSVDAVKNTCSRNVRDHLAKAKDVLDGSSPPAVAHVAASELVCAGGLPARRGYQILGPEGWRTFNQDERLVLAMSNSGKPLLETIRDLSNRVMAQKTSGLSTQALARESLAVANARTQVESINASVEPKDMKDKLNAVLEAFQKDALEGR